MTKEKIEKLRKIAIEVAEAHNRTAGLCGFSPGYDFNTYKCTPSVHLDNEAFYETFDKDEFMPQDDECDRVRTVIDGVEFFTLVPRNEVE